MQRLVEQKNQTPKDYVQYASIYMKFKNRQNYPLKKEQWLPFRG